METGSLTIPSLFTLLCAWTASALFSTGILSKDIQTSSGPVRGTEVKYNGQTVSQYLGIPFAKPPIGDLRFQKPQPMDKWTKTLVADKQPPACIQYIEYPFPWYDFEDGKSEDCLYLNIWVPKSILGRLGIKKIPVIFWLYGGGFTVGSNRKRVYEGQALAAEGGVVVVTINYRMTALGFLTSNTDDAPGNYGIYDMVSSLKWVNENIDAFGGDSSKVTLAGQSSGSIAIGLLCVSPLTEGLYQKVIMESGSPAYLLAENDTVNVAESQKLAKALGCADDNYTIENNPKEVVNCLREVDAMKIAKTVNSFHPKSARSFFPTYNTEILPKNARKALIDGDFHKADVLIGNNKDEGVFQITTGNPDVFGFFGEKNPQINKSYGESMLRNIFETFADPDAVIQYYLGDLNEDDYDEVRHQVYTASSDYSLLCPTVYFAESYSKKKYDVHYYFFVHRPSNTPWAEWMGVVHYEEVQFVFGVPLQVPKNYTSDEVRLSKKIIKIWSTFAKNGINALKLSWPQYSREDPTYVELDTSPRTTYGEGPHKDNCDFFRQYFGFD